MLLFFVFIFSNSVFANLYIVKDYGGKIIAIINQDMLDKIDYQKLGCTSKLWLEQTEKNSISLNNIVKDWESQIKESEMILEEETEKSKTEVDNDRKKIIDIFKQEASAKWGENYEMVNYTVKNQIQAYDWIINQKKYPDIIVMAKKKWQNNYEMIKYMYENQVKAYEWILNQTAYTDIMESAKRKWGGDYEMVKYEYENQVEAYKALQN